MSEERLEILKMLHDKTITVEEAERLLAALEEGERGRKAERPGFWATGLGESLKGLGTMVRGAVEDTIAGTWMEPGDEQLEEITLSAGGFELPAGGHLLVRQLFPREVELVAAAGESCTVEGLVAGVRRGGSRAILTLGNKAAKVHVPASLEELRVVTTAGPVHADGLAHRLLVRTLGGNVSLTSLRRPFEVRTVGGRVSLELAAELQGECVAETMGGHVEITVPPELRVRLRAQALAESIQVDPAFGEAFARDTRGEQRAVLDLGGPDAEHEVELRVRTVGGRVRVQRKAR